MRAQKVGVQKATAIHRCIACGGQVVDARDDRFPEMDLVDIIDVEPTATAGGVVLWYEVTANGKPIGHQWFREIDPATDSDGLRWTKHSTTCRTLPLFPPEVPPCT